MAQDPPVVTDPDSYGRAGHRWHERFVAYMVYIVGHPNYQGMPDAVKDDGKIQWEAPSNRPPGKYQDTHHKRRDWWRAKARELGVDSSGNFWISTTAKQLHPTGVKPCKRCGREMRIAYAYPSRHLVRRVESLFPDFDLNPLEPLTELVRLLHSQYGRDALIILPRLFETKSIHPPNLGEDLGAWIGWVEDEYIVQEPSMCSPGAMSNAPDRFDGFHSFNLCCRKKADTGRHDENMRTYLTERRVFEYWSDGDWIAADRLMGLVHARFQSEPCADGGTGPSSADHIGPLSLGFCHRPEFRLLSKAANSAKNNRMTLWDVRHLIAREREGCQVISWYGQGLWDRCMGNVHDKETALRLSKLLRDNQRNAMHLLGQVLDHGYYTFLSSMLGLDCAEDAIEFRGLRIEGYLTVYDSIVREPRVNKYVLEQKCRRLRIGVESLGEYLRKEGRHFQRIDDPGVDDCMERLLDILSSAGLDDLDSQVGRLLNYSQGQCDEEGLRSLIPELPGPDLPAFQAAKDLLRRAMDVIATRLADAWEDERYVRSGSNPDST